MFLTWEISLGVFCQQMCMQDLKDYRDKMYCTYVVPMSMEQQLKWKLWRKRKRLNKYAITIMGFTKKFMNGLTLALTISEGQAQNGIQKFVRKSSLVYKNTIEYKSKVWPNAIVKNVTYF